MTTHQCEDCGRTIRLANSPETGTYCTCLDGIQDLAVPIPANIIDLQIDPRSFDVTLTVNGAITDDQAATITYRADAEQVRIGGFVQVIDAGGIRIGHVASATFHRGSYFGPEYVVCTIELT